MTWVIQVFGSVRGGYPSACLTERMSCSKDKIETVPITGCLPLSFIIVLTTPQALCPPMYILPSFRLLYADIDVSPQLRLKEIIDGPDVETKLLPEPPGCI